MLMFWQSEWPISQNNCLLRLVPDKATETKKALKKLDLAVLTHEIIIVSLPNKPGASGGALTKLSKGKVNTDYSCDPAFGRWENAMCVLSVSDAKKKLLGSSSKPHPSGGDEHGPTFLFIERMGSNSPLEFSNVVYLKI